MGSVSPSAGRERIHGREGVSKRGGVKKEVTILAEFESAISSEAHVSNRKLAR